MTAIDHIVAATDFSGTSLRAVELAGRLAERFGARLSLLHVFDPESPTVQRAPVGAGRIDALRHLERAVEDSLAESRREKLEALEEVHIEALAHISPMAALCDYSSAHQANLVITGTHGRTGLAHFLIGSVAETVARHAPCRVLVVRPGVEVGTFPQHLMIATDFSEASEPAIEDAAILAGLFDCALSVVHVYGGPSSLVKSRRDARQKLADLEQRLSASSCAAGADDKGAAVRTELLSGTNAASAICGHGASQGVDLIVVATHGRSGLSHLLLGSVAQQVIRHASCPVWTARRHPNGKNGGED